MIRQAPEAAPRPGQNGRMVHIAAIEVLLWHPPMVRIGGW